MTYQEHIDLLHDLANDKDQTVECRRDVSGVLEQLGKFYTCIMLIKWDNILERIQKPNEALQKKGLALHTIQ